MIDELRARRAQLRLREHLARWPDLRARLADLAEVDVGRLAGEGETMTETTEQRQITVRLPTSTVERLDALAADFSRTALGAFAWSRAAAARYVIGSQLAELEAALGRGELDAALGVQAEHAGADAQIVVRIPADYVDRIEALLPALRETQLGAVRFGRSGAVRLLLMLGAMKVGSHA